MWGSYKRGDVLIGLFIVLIFCFLVMGSVTWMQEVDMRRAMFEERIIPDGTVMLEAMSQSKTTGDVIRFHIVVQDEDALRLEGEFLMLVRVKGGDYVGN